MIITRKSFLKLLSLRLSGVVCVLCNQVHDQCSLKCVSIILVDATAAVAELSRTIHSPQTQSSRISSTSCSILAFLKRRTVHYLVR